MLTEHGLSVYVETKRYKLLLDTGASDVFVRNAQTLGIDLSAVDYVFISHGHNDHAIVQAMQPCVRYNKCSGCKYRALLAGKSALNDPNFILFYLQKQLSKQNFSNILAHLKKKLYLCSRNENRQAS